MPLFREATNVGLGGGSRPFGRPWTGRGSADGVGTALWSFGQCKSRTKAGQRWSIGCHWGHKIALAWIRYATDSANEEYEKPQK